MGIFDNVASVIEAKATSVADYTWTELFPQSTAKSGVAVNIDSSLRVTTVFACARVLAEGIAQLPLCIYDEDSEGNKTEFKGPIVNILARRPNDWMTSFELREQMTMHAVLAGNAYAYLGIGNGQLREIIPLVPGSVVVQRNVDWSLEYHVSDLAGRTTIVPNENILHLKGPSWNGYLGMEAIQLAREAIGLAIATEETHASLHANGAQPGGVLAVKGKLDAPARDRLKTAWQAFQGGVANRFKTAVLDTEATWTPMSMTGVDSQHLETRRFQIEEICRAMRVFPQMVMHSDKTSTFASAEAFFLSHVTHSLMPWVKRWQEALDHCLFEKTPNLSVKLSVKDILRGSSADQAAYYAAALGGARPETAYMTRNEVRKELGLNPIEGGDELPKPEAPPPAGGGPFGRKEYNPNQPRDSLGRFGEGGGSASGGADGNSHASGLYKAPTRSAEQLISHYGARELVDHVEAKLAASTPTNASVANGGHVLPNGEYTAERQKVHQAILKGVFNKEALRAAKPAPGESPVLSVIGGRGGSGKSFITKDGGPVDSKKSILLDSDKFKAALPEYEGWNAAMLHEEATTLLDKADEYASKLGINVTHDATLKSEGTSAARIAAYTSKGYKANGYFVHATAETAVGRALGRVVRGGGRGRYVPPHVILANTSNESNFDKMKTGFAHWRVYDNNGDAPRLVAQGNN